MEVLSDIQEKWQKRINRITNYFPKKSGNYGYIIFNGVFSVAPWIFIFVI